MSQPQIAKDVRTIKEAAALHFTSLQQTVSYVFLLLPIAVKLLACVLAYILHLEKNEQVPVWFVSHALLSYAQGDNVGNMLTNTAMLQQNGFESSIV